MASQELQATNALDYEAIRNTVARYCIALDTKNFDLLNEVFVPDVEAYYPFRKEFMKGITTLVETITGRLKHVTTQHALTTQMIQISEAGKSATTTTYFTGVHFGAGRWEGKALTVWGRYEDELTVSGIGASDIQESSGRWLISKRTVVFMGSLGEEGVRDG